jgi:16S rRNA (adenine1518-N6/adenine1519-N6)-dimethyltransferase
MNKDEIKLLFTQLEFIPKKQNGQNFLIDDSVVDEIITLSEPTKQDIVLEIGAGLGALTNDLILKAKKVHAYEKDPVLFKYLKREYINVPNIELTNKDILKANLPPHNKVVSNPPYSITGPLLEKVFFHFHPPEGILTIEKSLADRIFTKNNYKTFSRISVSVNSFMKPVKQIAIPRNAFYPKPSIKLALIKMEPHPSIHPFLKYPPQKQFYLDFINGIMPYKNKDIGNAIQFFLEKTYEASVQKQTIISKLKAHEMPNKKVFQFSYDEFPPLAEIFYKLN